MYNQVKSLSVNNKLNGYQRFCFSALKPFIIKGRHRRESKNKKQETRNKTVSTFAVYRLRHSETKKNIA